MQDFSASFVFEQTPAEVFAGVVNVSGWWSAAVQGSSVKLGDEFVYRHKEIHYSSHRLTEVVPNNRVAWLTTDSSINFVANKTEWTGTTIIFDISEVGSKTVLNFIHKGLIPSLACFEGCSGGWRYYLESLRMLITSGIGKPDQP